MSGLGGAEGAQQRDPPELTSLLWPSHIPPASRSGITLTAETCADLDLEPVVRELGEHDAERMIFSAGVLTNLTADPEVIAYRGQVITNLLEDAELRSRLADLRILLARLVRERHRPTYGFEWTVADVVHRLGELELYVDVAAGLQQALQPAHLRAAALEALHVSVEALVQSPHFEALRQELPALRARLDGAQSVTIGINLTEDLRPESATVLSVDTEKVEGRGGLLERLLGPEATTRGITPLRGGPNTSLRTFFPLLQSPSAARHNELVDDLRRLLERIVAPIGEAVERYLWAHSHDFVTLDAELSFMLNAVTLVERLRGEGLPMCCPETAPADERACRIEAGYSVSLALRTVASDRSPRPSPERRIVTNPILFGEHPGRVWILTGPNRGGKTTYTRAVGLAFVLFQAGLYVPCQSACMSPMDGLYTHFPSRENATPGEGRLDDEASRLAEIFQQATPHSLILLNEVLSGTSTVEALSLGYDAVRGLRLLGARSIYVTHLHELAGRIDEINATTPGDGWVASLVAEAGDGAETVDGTIHRSFRIRPGPSAGVSYASEIAEQHGISYGQLRRLLKKRGVIEMSAGEGSAIEA